MFEGILPIDKPFGMTSHDVVARIRRLSGQKRVGHAGTLDPMATGVLLLCLGEATRLSDKLMDGAKAYIARVSFGSSTDTDDALGTAISTSPSNVSPEALLSALKHQVGTVSQTPPAYSAIKQGGVPSYKRARAGITHTLQARQITVYRISLLATAAHENAESRLATADLLVHCGKGTYIRSIARDLGAELGCGAHLSALRRIASGGFMVDRCVSIVALAALVAQNGSDAVRTSMCGYESALTDLPIAVFGEGNVSRIRNGQHVDAMAPNLESELSVYDGGGHLAAIASVSPLEGMSMRVQPAKVFGKSRA